MRISDILLIICSSQHYVAVKVLAKTSQSERAINSELDIYRHLSQVHSSHIGSAYIRGLYDAFDIQAHESVYRCLVHPPMHMSIHELLVQARSHKLSEDLLKQNLICLFQALDFLHNVSGVVHSGITLLFGFRNTH